MPQTKKGRNLCVSKGAKPTNAEIDKQPQCHIHDKVGNWEVGDIRKNVCVNDESLIEYDGKYYCLFHLPTKEKDVDRFTEIFQIRLNSVKEKISKIK